jgi:hypothetical protein
MYRTGFVIATLALFTSVPSFACGFVDVFRVNYFKTNSAAKSEVMLVNPGAGATCALIYVFKPDQEFDECCGCVITANATLTGTVEDNFTNNPVNGVHTTVGAIKIISSAPHSTRCDPTSPIPTPTLREWITHVGTVGVSGWTTVLTETEFSQTVLSSTELSSLANQCAITKLTSGTGVCTCPAEAATTGATTLP